MEIKSCSCTVSDHTMCASRVPIFSCLNEDELKQVVSLIIQKKYEKSAFIVSEGNVLRDFIIVSSGKIKVCGYAQDGKEQIMYILNKGDFFGVKHLIQEKVADFNIQAMDDTVLCTICQATFRKLLERYPAISFKIMDELCNRLDKMESMFRRISPKDVDARVNLMLLEFSQKYGRKQTSGILVELPMSREEMANYIGVARETVSRKIASLKEEGIIEIIGSRKILILNEEFLENSL